MVTTPAALRTPAAQNLIAATTAGVAVLARPSRFPKWARRGLSMANTAGTAGSVFLGAKKSPSESAGAKGALGLKPVNEKSAGTAAAGSALAAAAGGLSLITSGIGQKVDLQVENYLLRKGVKHPRIWMAIGVVGAVFIVKTVQDAIADKATDKAKQFAAKSGEGHTTKASDLLSGSKGDSGKHAATTGMSDTEKREAIDEVPSPKIDATPASEKVASDPEEVAKDTGRPVADPADD